MEAIKARLQKLYAWLDARTGGVLSTVQAALERFGETEASQAAAGMAYFTFFSLFPLLLLMISIIGFLLSRSRAYEETLRLAQQALPVSQHLLQENLQQVLELRGTVGAVSLVSLLWSASGAFTMLSQHINHAWPDAEERGFVSQRLIGIGMVAVLLLFLLLSLASSAVLDVLPRLEIPLNGGVVLYETLLWRLANRVVPWLFIFIMFVALYRWVPNVVVSWRAALWAAFVAATGWELGKEAFTWYVSSGLVRYRLVYGSLGTVVALLFWIYLSMMVTLFAAHLGAAIDRQE